jgi:hypothetical protein
MSSSRGPAIFNPIARMFGGGKKSSPGALQSALNQAGEHQSKQAENMRRDILSDQGIDHITRRELLGDLHEAGSSTKGLKRVQRTLGQARAGEGDKFRSRQATQQMFKTMREQPGHRQTRATRQTIL